MGYPRRLLILPAALCFWLLAQPARAGELYGTVYTGGAPAANLSFTVKGRKERVATDTRGRYSVDLPPGDYVLIIKGKNVPVTVKAERTQRDVRL